MRSRGRELDGRRGQALVEFALVLVILLLLLSAAIDFGFLYKDRLAVANAARVGVRWAVKNPLATDPNAVSSSTPDSSSIQGQVILAGGTQAIKNDGNDIKVEWYKVDPVANTLTHCGAFQITAPGNPGTGAMVYDTGYSQSNCVIAGDMIKVTVTHSYFVVTPFFSSFFGPSVTVVSSAAMLEET